MTEGLKQGFLPVTKAEMLSLGWEQPDFVYVSGDAYVDHPSFGHAIISRVLENAGYRVCMLPQPDYHSCEDFKRFGLYVFCKDNLSDFDVLKTLRYVRSLQSGCEKHYSALFLSEISTLHVCRLDDGIKKEDRIISMDIDPELRRRLFLESVKY